MLFNSFEFLFVFLPIVLFIYFGLASSKLKQWTIGGLTLSSLFFYGWWDPRFLLLILGSILFNFLLGQSFYLHKKHTQPKLVIGVTLNLALLGYFKYTNFIVDNITALWDTQFILAKIALPLGVSFFTFLQISYLVDAARSKSRPYRFTEYCLFVTFFPHLIAGPLVHHDLLIPQFQDPQNLKFNTNNISAGLTIFTFGLFKKVIIADHLSPLINPLFTAAQSGSNLTFIESWLAALGYTFQLYFDFSGYSDMAIGLSLLFNFRLPINFFSPYKAHSIIEFWRRWHITLSNFLRDYLYIPLGGNRHGPARRYVNLMITMLLGGLWHGAGWTFVIWGGLHGSYLLINHFWQTLTLSKTITHQLWWKRTSHLLTFICVTVAWVFFRSPNTTTALQIINGMLGRNGISLPERLAHFKTFTNIGFDFNGLIPSADIAALPILTWTGIATFIAWLLPNTMEMTWNSQPALDTNRHLAKSEQSINTMLKQILTWQANKAWAVIMAILLTISVLHLSMVSEFLYFQF